jgi:Protein of unknown function (DUF2946)
VIRVLRSRYTQAVAGFTVLGLLLQALLFVVHFSLMAAPKFDAADLVFNIICTDHGAQTRPAPDAPSDRQSGCMLCPLCWTGGGGPVAVLPGTVVLAIVRPARMLDFYFDRRLTVVAYSNLPPSRGPPPSPEFFRARPTDANVV